MNLRTIQFVVFLIVPLVNFGVNYFYPSPFDDDMRVLIQPAGYAFSIWGPIFLGMILYSWFQMKDDRVESKYLNNASKAGILAGLASIAFVPISYTDIQWLAFLNILWHLGALLWLFTSLRQQVKLESQSKTHLYYLPTQMYLGWICAATAVSAALMLTEAGVHLDLGIQVVVTVIIIGVLVLIGGYMVYNDGRVIPLVFIWALMGVIVENGSFPAIKYGSLIAIAILAVITIPQIIKSKRLAY